MDLAKAYQQLAGENVALKAGVTYFAYSPEYGFDYFKDKQSAIDTAQEEIDAYREDADDGWSEDVQRVSWGVVIQQAQGFDAQGLHTSDSQHTYQTCNYRLVDSVATPATDRIVAGIKARVIPEGFKLVPEQMYLSDEDIQAICMQCGNGDKKGYGDYEDGILWVGELSNDGEMKYGLNIANANYPEEGSITVFEFDEPLREGADK